MDGAPILRSAACREDIRTILSHAAEQSGVHDVTLRDRALYAGRATGLVTAVALVCPSKDIRDVKVKSIKKKWEDRASPPG